MSFIIVFNYKQERASSVLSQILGSEIFKRASDIALLAVNYRSHWHCGGRERKQSPYLFLF